MGKFYNRAKMTITSGGTGTLTLGSAANGYQTFANSGAQNGDTVSYAIEDGLMFEVGNATYNSTGPTLSNRVVTNSYDGTTYGTNKLTVSTNALVFITPLAADLATASSVSAIPNPVAMALVFGS